MSKSQPAPRTTHEADVSEVDHRPPEPIDPADRVAVAAGLADMRAGRIAKPSEVEAVYSRFGRRQR